MLIEVLVPQPFTSGETTTQDSTKNEEGRVCILALSIYITTYNANSLFMLHDDYVILLAHKCQTECRKGGI